MIRARRNIIVYVSVGLRGSIRVDTGRYGSIWVDGSMRTTETLTFRPRRADARMEETGGAYAVVCGTPRPSETVFLAFQLTRGAFVRNIDVRWKREVPPASVVRFECLLRRRLFLDHEKVHEHDDRGEHGQGGDDHEGGCVHDWCIRHVYIFISTSFRSFSLSIRTLRCWRSNSIDRRGNYRGRRRNR